MTTNRTQQQQAADEKAERERQAADEKAERERQAAEQAERERQGAETVPADDERAKLYVVLSRTSDGQEHFSIQSAESADGLKEPAVHAYGISPDDVTVYELRTV